MKITHNNINYTISVTEEKLAGSINQIIELSTGEFIKPIWSENKITKFISIFPYKAKEIIIPPVEDLKQELQEYYGNFSWSIRRNCVESILFGALKISIEVNQQEQYINSKLLTTKCIANVYSNYLDEDEGDKESSHIIYDFNKVYDVESLKEVINQKLKELLTKTLDKLQSAYD